MISFFIKIVEIIVLYKRVLTMSKNTVECKREGGRLINLSIVTLYLFDVTIRPINYLIKKYKLCL